MNDRDRPETDWRNHAPDPDDVRRLAFEDPAFMWRDEMRAMRLATEYAKCDLAMRDWRIRSTVVFFGGAHLADGHTPDQDPYYGAARELAHRVAARGEALFHASGETVRDFVVATGGGPGIMEAANRGAAEAGAPTIGLNIAITPAQPPNAWVTPALNFCFQYFALRKMHFLLRARGLVFFPGGFGTLDELFDALTLMQTGKMPRMPLLMFGRDYWDRVIDFTPMVEAGTISAADHALISWPATTDEALEILTSFEGPPAPAGGEPPDI